MDQDPKLKAFGIWLTEFTEQKQLELLSVCGNDKAEIATVKRKFGHYESANLILQAFTELYQNGIDKFEKNYLEKEPSNDD